MVGLALSSLGLLTVGASRFSPSTLLSWCFLFSVVRDSFANYLKSPS